MSLTRAGESVDLDLPWAVADAVGPSDVDQDTAKPRVTLGVLDDGQQEALDQA